MSAEYARRQALIHRPRIVTEPMPVQAQRMAEARARFYKATPLYDIVEGPVLSESDQGLLLDFQRYDRGDRIRQDKMEETA